MNLQMFMQGTITRVISMQTISHVHHMHVHTSMQETSKNAGFHVDLLIMSHGTAGHETAEHEWYVLHKRNMICTHMGNTVKEVVQKGANTLCYKEPA